MSISLQYPGTGRVKTLPEGWNWSCFFGATILGLPLFRLGLVVWGSTMLAFDFVTVIVGFIDTLRACTSGCRSLAWRQAHFSARRRTQWQLNAPSPMDGDWPTGIGDG
jgi:hypothetical protein